MSANEIRRLAQKAVHSVPQSNDVSVNSSARLNYSSVNGSNNLLPEELIESTGTTQASVPTNTLNANNVVGVSNDMLNNTTRTFDNNVNTNDSLVNPVVNMPVLTEQNNLNLNSNSNSNSSNGRSEPVQTSSTSLTYRALNDNSINNINLKNNNNTISVPVNVNNMTDNEFENVTLQITNNLNNVANNTNANNGNNVNKVNNVTKKVNNVNNVTKKVNNVNNVTKKVNNVNNVNANNLSNIDEDNIREEDLDTELKNIINEIKEIDDSRESKNYKITIGIILAILVIILICVVSYFVISKKQYLNSGVESNESMIETIKNNIRKVNNNKN